ncbi:KH domain-containing protein [Sandaracinus amylolyticus]|uniref:KH domain-containing protein n=1 Tax=Sandaracinus amylolyticus TaxID=927083 RepID=UPI00069E463B|nr:KH domain-containing protein [Sandaracinus amylolyticus]UJR80602.1 KH domain RNA binding protein YlqC [Sandaracinus amylolyticus]
MDEPKLEELLTFIARNLVDEPDEVRVQAVDGDRATVYELSVAEDDLGKVIGKDGRTARAIRTLLAATSARLRKRAILEILE